MLREVHIAMSFPQASMVWRSMDGSMMEHAGMMEMPPRRLRMDVLAVSFVVASGAVSKDAMPPFCPAAKQ
jgi:hypothetical protein